MAEPVARRAVVGQELDDLDARRGVKQVGGARLAAVVVVSRICSTVSGWVYVK